MKITGVNALSKFIDQKLIELNKEHEAWEKHHTQIEVIKAKRDILIELIQVIATGTV